VESWASYLEWTVETWANYIEGSVKFFASYPEGPIVSRDSYSGGQVTRNLITDSDTPSQITPLYQILSILTILKIPLILSR